LSLADEDAKFSEHGLRFRMANCAEKVKSSLKINSLTLAVLLKLPSFGATTMLLDLNPHHLAGA